MHRKSHVLIITVATFTMAGSALAAGRGMTNAGSVHVQRNPSISGDVHVSLRPTDRLPPGGYYYAVIVLRKYKQFTAREPPPCATSSNMEKTDYAYPHPGRPIEIALTQAKSLSHRWCRGGIYSGGIYAVPYPPPCDSTYPCRSEPYKEPCVGVEPGCVLGVVAKPDHYHYPDELPTPLAKGTRIVAHFRVTF
jgi:hypothetical protein